MNKLLAATPSLAVFVACAMASSMAIAQNTIRAINVGNGAWTAPDKTVFAADAPYDKVRGFGFIGGSVGHARGPVDDAFGELYRQGRWGEFEYRFDLSNGLYDVELFFIEGHFAHPAQRVFNIALNGEIVEPDFDICRLTGPNRPVSRKYTTAVTNGVLRIVFEPVFDHPTLNAIRIRPTKAPGRKQAKPSGVARLVSRLDWDARTGSPYVLGGRVTPEGRVGNILVNSPVKNGGYTVSFEVTPPAFPRWVSVRVNGIAAPAYEWRGTRLDVWRKVTNSTLRIEWTDVTRRVPLSRLRVLPATTKRPAPSKVPPVPPASSFTDDEFLDHVARSAFDFFVYETDPRSGLTRDTSRAARCSSASCGFGLSALAYGAERGWISRGEAERIALKMLTTLNSRKEIQREGLFPHFITLEGELVKVGETGISTIDSALLFMGVLTAGEYFGGDVARIAQRIIRNANWRAYFDTSSRIFYMAWTPQTAGDLRGPGRYHCYWGTYTDETILVNVLACGAPVGAHRAPGSVFYAWKRPVARYGKGAPFIRSSPNNVFTYVFAHLWIDFEFFGVDRDGVDWWSNTYHAVVADRRYCIDRTNEFATFGVNRWGLSPCAAGNSYLVPQPVPNHAGHDVDVEGTVAPYAAGMALPFLPREAIAALREMYGIELAGVPLWAPRDRCGYGFWDSFNLDKKPPLVTKTVIGIDQGPLLMSIANYRHQFFWKLLRKNEVIRRGMKEVGFRAGSRCAKAK